MKFFDSLFLEVCLLNQNGLPPFMLNDEMKNITSKS